MDPKDIPKLNAQYLSNNDRLKETQSIVRDKAREFARNIILEKIKQEVGKLNVGIRQTLTVESVDEKTNKKNDEKNQSSRRWLRQHRALQH